MEQLNKLIENKNVLILGYGREGYSTYRYLMRHFPTMPIAIADRKKIGDLPKISAAFARHDPLLTVYEGDSYLDNVGKYNLIIKAPGIPGTLPQLQAAVAGGSVMTSQINEFLKLFSNRCIGVTGTKGKSTTASLIRSIIYKSGHYDVHVLGNIGRPVFDVVDGDDPGRRYVLELSSHQLTDCTVSPHIAVFLNLYPEHLDYHQSLELYRKAKQRITDFQTPDDYLIYNAADPDVAEAVSHSRAKKIGFSLRDDVPARYTVRDGYILDNGNKAISLAGNRLIGNHNLNNIMAAAAVADVYNIGRAKISGAIASFAPLEYRLQSIGTRRGIEFFDDALATIPEAAVAALDALGDRVATMIVGGFDRGLSFDVLAKTLAGTGVSTLILFPTTGERIWKTFSDIAPRKAHQLRHFPVTSMEEAVKLAYRNTPEGKICLMSPASPSFGLFRDYKDRSDQYRVWVKKLGTGTNS